MTTKRKLQLLTWLPLIGIIFEVIIVDKYLESYMTDSDRGNFWYFGTIFYHFITTIILLLSILTLFL